MTVTYFTTKMYRFKNYIVTPNQFPRCVNSMKYSGTVSYDDLCCRKICDRPWRAKGVLGYCDATNAGLWFLTTRFRVLKQFTRPLNSVGYADHSFCGNSMISLRYQPALGARQQEVAM